MDKKEKEIKYGEGDLESEGDPLCPECGSKMVKENGELICPNCDKAIDFFGEEEE